MTDFNRQVGAMPMPTTATGDPDFSALVPGHKTMLALFRAAITADIGPLWASARLGTALAASPVVQSSKGVMPSKEMLQEQGMKFPALFVYEMPEPPVFGQFSLRKRFMQRTWAVEYVLGTLDSAEWYKLQFLLGLFCACVDQVVKIKGHSAYAMDANDVWPLPVLTELPHSAFYEVNLTGVPVYGPAIFEGSIYYGARATLTTREFDGVAVPGKGAQPHTGMHMQLGGDEEGTVQWMNETISTIPTDQ